MYKNFKRYFSLVIAVTLIVSCVPVFGGTAVQGIGTEVRHKTTQIHDDAVLHETTLLHSGGGRQEERYIEMSADSPLTAMTVSGSTLVGGNLTMLEAAAKLKNKGYTVVAGMNADFFTLANGVPCGVLISDSIIRCSDNNQYAIGFLPGGGAVIGQPRMTVTANTVVGGVETPLSIKQINRIREDDGIYLFTPDFADTTRTTLEGTHVIISVTGNLSVGGTVTGTIASVVSGKDAAAIKAGQMVLSANNKGPADKLRALTVGEQITINVTLADNRFQNCSFVVGGQYKLVTNSVVNSGLAAGTAPRTAVGVKSDGSVVFYTVDGRQTDYSVGLSLTDVSKRMMSLGCVDVLELDGGGSTVMGAVYPGKTDVTVLGKPSDGSLRKCSNYIFLVNSTPKLGSADKVFVYPNSVTMLKGSSVTFAAATTDRNYHPVSGPVPYWTAEDASVGSMSGSGVFTAAETGDTQVYAQTMMTEGTAEVRVVDTVNSISVINSATGKAVTSLAVKPNEKVNLSAKAYIETVEVQGQNNSFTWETTVGEIDANGVFTASGSVGGGGEITVSYGSTKATVKVAVGRIPEVICDFENSVHGLTGGANIQAALEQDLTKVRYGKRSGKITYNFAGQTETVLALKTEIALKNSPSHVYLWVYGDNSGNNLTALFVDLANMPVELSGGVIDFAGWKLINLKLPAGTAKFTGLRVTKTEKGAEKGTIYADQITQSYTETPDVTPPVITLDLLDMVTTPGVMEISLNAHDGGAALDKSRLSLTYDGSITAFEYDTVTCKLTARVEVPEGGLHIINAEAADSAGNRARFSYSLDLTEEDFTVSSLVDMEGHWSKSFVTYLDGRGALTAKTTDEGREFKPDVKLTRSEMAIFITRVMKVNTALYDEVVLPFTDLSSLPVEALPAIRAAYSLGMIQGKSNYGGPAYFDPNGTVSRADFMTIVGRSLSKGYAVKTLTFTDVAKIPAYARDHVEVMVSLGIVQGYSDNTLMPLREVTRAEAAKMLFYFY